MLIGINSWKYHLKATDKQKEDYEKSSEIEESDVTGREEAFSRNRSAICERIRTTKKVSGNVDRENEDEVPDNNNIAANEAVYSRNRSAINKEMQTSAKIVSRVVRGFFFVRDFLHNHFIFIADIGEKDLRCRILENLDAEMTKMEKFVLKKSNDPKQKNYNKLKEIEAQIQTDYNGARTLKDLYLLLMAGQIIDKGNEFLMMPEETRIPTSQPFLRVRELPDR